MTDYPEKVKARSALRLPGRIFEQIVPLAQLHVEDGDPDQDVADAVSRARVKRRGGGMSFLIPVDVDGALRLADWIADTAPAELRRYRDAIREQASR